MKRRIVSTVVIYTLIFLSICHFVFASEKIEELYLRSDYPAVIGESGKILSKGANQPNLDKVYFYLGLSNMKLGNLAEARNDFNILLRNFSSSKLKDRANLAIADTYFWEENYSQANNYYEKLTADANSDILSLVFYKLSQANMKLGNWQKAKNYLEKLKNEFPGSFEASLAKDMLVTGDFFTVQVGSFMVAEKAKKLAGDLKSGGFDSYITEVSSQGKTFYRVRVGKLSTLQEVKELEQKLAEKNYPTKIFP